MSGVQPQKPSVSFTLQLVKVVEPYLPTIETVWGDRKITGFQFTVLITGCCRDAKQKRSKSAGTGNTLGQLGDDSGLDYFFDPAEITSGLIRLPLPSPASLKDTEQEEDSLAKTVLDLAPQSSADLTGGPDQNHLTATDPYVKELRYWEKSIFSVHNTTMSKRDVSVESFENEEFLSYCVLGIFVSEAQDRKSKTLTFTDFRAFVLNVTLGAKAAVEEFDVKPITLTRTMKSKHLYHMNRIEMVKDQNLLAASVTGGSDSPAVIRLLDLHSMQVTQELKLKMNQGNVNCLSVVSVIASVLSQAKLNLLFVASSDNFLRAFDMSRLRLIRAKIPFKEAIQVIKYVEKLNIMILGSQRGTLYKVKTSGIEKWAHSHDPAKCFPASPNPASVTCHEDMVTGIELDGLCESLFTCSIDRNICQVNLKTWKTIRVIKGHKLGILSIAYNPFYNTLVTCGMEYALYSWALEVWNVEPMLLIDPTHPYTNPIQQVRTVPTKPIAISLDSKGTFKVWDLRNGACVSSATCEPEMMRAEMSNLTWPYFALDPVSLDIVTAANRKCYIFEYDVDDKALGPYCAHEGPVSGALVDRKTNTLFSTSKQELQAWDIPNLKPINRIRELVSTKVTSVCLLPGIGCLVLGTANGTLTVVRTSSLSSVCAWVQQSQSAIVDICLAPKKPRPKKLNEWSTLANSMKLGKVVKHNRSRGDGGGGLTFSTTVASDPNEGTLPLNSSPGLVNEDSSNGGPSFLSIPDPQSRRNSPSPLPEFQSTSLSNIDSVGQGDMNGTIGSEKEGAASSSLGGTLPPGVERPTTVDAANQEIEKYCVFCAISISGHAEVLVVDTESWTIESVVLLRNDVSIRASSCCLHLDGNILLVGEHDNTVSYWEMTTLRPPQFKEVMVGINVPADRACIALSSYEGSPNLPLFIAGDSAGWFHMWCTGETNMWSLARWPNRKPPELKHIPKTVKIIFDSTHLLLIVGDDFGMITIFDVSTVLLGEKGKFRGSSAGLTLADVPNVHQGRSGIAPPCIAFWEAHPESNLTTMCLVTNPFVLVSGGEDCRLQMWSLGGGAMGHFVLRKIGQDVQDDRSEQIDMTNEDPEKYNDLPPPYGRGNGQMYGVESSANMLMALNSNGDVRGLVTNDSIVAGKSFALKKLLSFPESGPISNGEQQVSGTFELTEAKSSSGQVDVPDFGPVLEDQEEVRSQTTQVSESQGVKSRKSKKSSVISAQLLGENDSKPQQEELPKLPPIHPRFFHRETQVKTEDGEVIEDVPQFIGLHRLNDAGRPRECAYIQEGEEGGGSPQDPKSSQVRNIFKKTQNDPELQPTTINRAMYGPMSEFKKLTDAASLSATKILKATQHTQQKMSLNVTEVAESTSAGGRSESPIPGQGLLSPKQVAETLEKNRSSPHGVKDGSIGVGDVRELRRLAAKASTPPPVTGGQSLNLKRDQLVPIRAGLGPALSGGSTNPDGTKSRRPHRLGALGMTAGIDPRFASQDQELRRLEASPVLRRASTTLSSSQKITATQFDPLQEDIKQRENHRRSTSTVPATLLKKRAKSVEPIHKNQQFSKEEIQPFVLDENTLVPSIRPLAGNASHVKTHKPKAF